MAEQKQKEKKRPKVIEFMTAPTTIVSVLGTGIGLGEALLYYNLGKNSGVPLLKMKLGVPPKSELIRTFSVVVVTSVLTGILTDLVLKGVLPEEQYMALHPDEKKKPEDKSKPKKA